MTAVLPWKRLSLSLVAVGCAIYATSDFDWAGNRLAANQNTQTTAQAEALTCRFPSAARPPAFLSRAPRSGDSVHQYSGTIGTRSVTMLLRQVDGDLSGYYFYAAFRSPIQVRGRATPRGFTLTEYGDLRQPWRTTGFFDAFQSLANASIQGTWRSENGTKSFRFALNRDATRLDREVLFTWDGGTSMDYSPTTNQLVFLEQPDTLGIFNLSTMSRRTLLKFRSHVTGFPRPDGRVWPVGGATVSAVVMSHAGDRVAFNGGPESFQDVYVMRTAGDDTRPLRLTDSLGDFSKEMNSFYQYSNPKFSPDDTMLVFQIFHGPVSDTDPNNRIAVVNSTGGAVRTLGEGYAERAYWSADGTRVCTYTQILTDRKIVYDVRSGQAFVGDRGSYLKSSDRTCRTIADAASVETCNEPADSEDFEIDRLYSGSGRLVVQRWVTPDIVINTYELPLRFTAERAPARPGRRTWPGLDSRFQIVRFLN